MRKGQADDGEKESELELDKEGLALFASVAYLDRNPYGNNHSVVGQPDQFRLVCRTDSGQRTSA